MSPTDTTLPLTWHNQVKYWSLRLPERLPIRGRSRQVFPGSDRVEISPKLAIYDHHIGAGELSAFHQFLSVDVQQLPGSGLDRLANGDAGGHHLAVFRLQVDHLLQDLFRRQLYHEPIGLLKRLHGFFPLLLPSSDRFSAGDGPTRKPWQFGDTFFHQARKTSAILNMTPKL
jgi:hypothetical protein